MAMRRTSRNQGHVNQQQETSLRGKNGANNDGHVKEIWRDDGNIQVLEVTDSSAEVSICGRKSWTHLKKNLTTVSTFIQCRDGS